MTDLRIPLAILLCASTTGAYAVTIQPQPAPVDIASPSFTVWPQTIDPDTFGATIEFDVDRRGPVIPGLPGVPLREAQRLSTLSVSETGSLSASIYTPAFSGGARLAEIKWVKPMVRIPRALVIDTAKVTLTADSVVGVSLVFQGERSGQRDAVYLGTVRDIGTPAELNWHLTAFNLQDQRIDDEARFVVGIRIHFPFRDPRVDYRRPTVSVDITGLTVTALGVVPDPPNPVAHPQTTVVRPASPPPAEVPNPGSPRPTPTGSANPPATPPPPQPTPTGAASPAAPTPPATPRP